MRTRVTYITEDNQEFDNQFDAKKHECELKDHIWDFYAKGMALQKKQDAKTIVKFCKHCHKQVFLKKIK